MNDVLGPYHRWIMEQPCLIRYSPLHVCRTLGRSTVEGHHLRTRAAGGKDYGNEVPLCPLAHSEIHTLGPTLFNRKYAVDVYEEAATLGRLWDARLDAVEWYPIADSAGRVHHAVGPRKTLCGAEASEPHEGPVDCCDCIAEDRF